MKRFATQESVQRQDLLFGSLPQEIMTRLGQLKLIQRKVSRQSWLNGAAFFCFRCCLVMG
jgi:hypothetical protein